MRVLIFHGYLLSGTGSNVYNARLAEALVREGHEVHLLCQDRHPERQHFVDAWGDWDAGRLELHSQRRPARCTVYRPAIGSLLPVYVADRYEGLEARRFQDCSDAEIAAYVAANVDAVQQVVARVAPQAALANHAVMGPLVLARALAGSGVPYAVKVHGSALEYTVRADLARFLAAACEGLAAARGVLVGSRHVAERLWLTVDDPQLRERTRLGPPGVDPERFAPRRPAVAADGLEGLIDGLQLAGDLRPAASEDPAAAVAEGDSFARDELAAAAALRRLAVGEDRLVSFVGKLIVSKGVDLLVAAWPLVLQEEPRARLVIVGFGAFRPALERLIAALSAGDLQAARGLALLGRDLEVDPSAVAAADGTPRSGAGPLHRLLAHLDALDGARRERYVSCARRLSERIVIVGRLDHDELADLLPCCEASVVPSTFPEAFGMVAVEAAACGSFPVVAGHSGLAEVASALATAVPQRVAPWLSFSVDDDPVAGIAERVVAWLDAEAPVREVTRAALVHAVRIRWSWAAVAEGVLDAAAGRLDRLPRVEPASAREPGAGGSRFSRAGAATRPDAAPGRWAPSAPAGGGE